MYRLRADSEYPNAIIIATTHEEYLKLLETELEHMKKRVLECAKKLFDEHYTDAFALTYINNVLKQVEDINFEYIRGSQKQG